ncbi:MAG TPA: hypothetical protein DCS07_07155 [Bdellovibrionales bacterium]|nr:MAG: hypothetical protein A2Z97_01085 [Bdellovibrionales bacterium GWB1_52_6]OFZ03600.1 MAG: hypothetical protein A2X97_00710 [Bdellovibrionales bacterium GWA1_52_35]OFZ34944.1 MAG: hypothetical protein A2070_14510 [Bdellovibrionales bacterium GWC1_52_8]HAR42397.1 hypothetical protein [Bdellovibrionales bacterium]HCM38916.1 hypothetical protein [Bdellovibrionales bacterium]
MAHLTDKPLGLNKLQSELKAAQSEIARLKAELSEKDEQIRVLEDQSRHLSAALSKKNKKAAQD